jgi:hypothetical protein
MLAPELLCSGSSVSPTRIRGLPCLIGANLINRVSLLQQRDSVQPAISRPRNRASGRAIKARYAWMRWRFAWMIVVELAPLLPFCLIATRVIGQRPFPLPP